MFLVELKCIVREKKISKPINNNLEISSDDSNEEAFDYLMNIMNLIEESF